MGGPGEPWVRYYGLPTEVEAGLADQHPEYADYFDKAGKLWKVSDKDGNGETTYYPYSPLNQYMFDKKVIIDYPVAPGAPKDYRFIRMVWIVSIHSRSKLVSGRT